MILLSQQEPVSKLRVSSFEVLECIMGVGGLFAASQRVEVLSCVHLFSSNFPARTEAAARSSDKIQFVSHARVGFDPEEGER